MYRAIASPINLRTVELKNRIIFVPTSLGLKGNEYKQRIEMTAAGGCAMIVIGDVPVSRFGSMSVHNRKGFAHYSRLCEIVYKQGC